jgi:hypothetical protein
MTSLTFDTTEFPFYQLTQRLQLLQGARWFAAVTAGVDPCLSRCVAGLFSRSTTGLHRQAA